MALTPNMRFPGYEILSSLGSGGMGEVYLARDMKLDRTVALKVLRSDLAADKDRLRRFVQEAKAASALNHPNIITVHEIAETSEGPFITTEFIEGETLRSRMSSASMKLGQVLDVAIQIGNALCVAHEAGIYHRDIKPENLMIRPDGIVKVLDFGLAKLTEGRSQGLTESIATTVDLGTNAGIVMGTIPYMSPEQARGLPIDARTDIFSLGVVIYEMITGNRPFEGRTANEVLSSLLSDEMPLPLARYSREVPAELERIVDKALRKNRDERYQTMKDLTLDLTSLKQNLEFQRRLERSLQSESGRTTDAREQGSRVAGIKKRTPLLSLTALIVIAIVAGGYYYRTIANARSIHAIAVLPFTDATADADTAHIWYGMTARIIGTLADLPSLKVIGHSSVIDYNRKNKGENNHLRDVGRDLGVEAVLTVHVVRRNDSVTLFLEVTDARDNSQIWSKQYESELADLQSIQRQIPVDIADNLRLRLSGEAKERLMHSQTANEEAYRLYFKGLFSFEKFSAEGTKQAIQFFNEAIEKDPNYALAHSGLAAVYMNFGRGPGPEVPRAEAHRRARDAAETALKIDSKLAEAHTALSQVLLYANWDFAGAERELLEAIKLSPSYTHSRHYYSHLLLLLGRFDESREQSEKLAELDPLSELPIGHLGYHYLRARQYDAAIKELQRALHEYPDSNNHINLGDAYFENEMFPQAVDEYLLGLRQELSVSEDKLEALKAAFDSGGIKGYLRKRIEQVQLDPRQEFGLARLYARLDDKDQALFWLEKAYDVHADNLVHLKDEPAFFPLHSDPRFIDLARRIKLPH